VQALTVEPGRADSARLEQIDEPRGPDGVLVELLEVGICGTDREILSGRSGQAPPGRSRLVLGHESLGRVLESRDRGLVPGDLVAALVRHPDPAPCASCAAGEWDMCENGGYTEHGIKALDGFCTERVRLAPEFLVPLDPELADVGVLVEPASVVAKAWEHIDWIVRRSAWRPRRVLVTGAGPIGLLAALLAHQRGYEIHVIDRATSGPKPDLVAGLGAAYHTGDVSRACADPDITLECTGAGELVLQALSNAGRNGIVCLTGVSSGGRTLPVNTVRLNRELVLENNVVFGTVNANRRHYQAAAQALARAERSWLERLITRRVPIDRWREALTRQPDDVKVTIRPQGARRSNGLSVSSPASIRSITL
jgi:threonine dehydrogenase-like Zn-dependent dehydrogenase